MNSKVIVGIHGQDKQVKQAPLLCGGVARQVEIHSGRSISNNRGKSNLTNFCPDPCTPSHPHYWDKILYVVGL